MADEQLQQRLMSFVTKAANGCWIWTGAYRDGYGAVKNSGQTVPAHRASFLAFKGEIPDGKLVMHTCDIPGCINPSHLILGEYIDNWKDGVAKGRIRVGYYRPERLPSGDEVAELLKRFDAGTSIHDLQVLYAIPRTSLKRLLAQHSRKMPRPNRRRGAW